MKRMKKLNINELKVQSFVTELQPEHAYTAKGGDDCITQTNVGDWIQCTKIVYDVYDKIAKEKSWFPYNSDCCSSNNPPGGGSGGGGSYDPGERMTFEYDSCPD